MSIDTPTLTGIAILGLVIGFSFLLNLEQGWRKKENAVNSPMSITLKTEKSPADLVFEARIARSKRWFMYLSIGVVVWIALRVRYPEAITSLEASLSSIISSILRSLSDLLVIFADALA